ncbi:hypothetical protein TNCV_145391 [Trichonephila clavipes]|nr:hypothetical protein TNCV_145391 [Trichonephila clavipes]
MLLDVVVLRTEEIVSVEKAGNIEDVGGESARRDEDDATEVDKLLNTEEAVLNKRIGGWDLDDVVTATEIDSKRCA